MDKFSQTGGLGGITCTKGFANLKIDFGVQFPVLM
jgi:hypothetical protein